MPDRIQGANNASQFSCPIKQDDGSTTTVNLGENTLADVARNRGIDRDSLVAVNPQITNPYALLSVGQEINLPFCQAPAPPKPAETPAAVSSGDPLAKSVANANLKKEPELSPEEKNFKATYGDAAFEAYKGVKAEYAEGRRVFQQTGQIPPLKYFAPIEIMTGKVMTRAERYDANLERQGKSASYPKFDVDVDPAYLTLDEFRQEWVARGSKEMKACEDEYIRPGKIQKCRLGVKEKYMGKEYMDASFAATAQVWNGGAYIEKIKNSGPIGLAGRVVGRTGGYLIGGKEGADKGEEIMGLVGDIGDVGVGVKGAATARGRVRNYQGSAGLELRRDAPVAVVRTPPQVTRGTQPDVPTVNGPSAKRPNETFFLTHGTDNPGFQQMGGLGQGRIRVDHSPGGRQDFSRGFYASVGESPKAIGAAESFGDLRVAQRGTGPRQVMAWQLKRSDLGDLVDVRPGGEHAAAWKKYLDQPVAAGVKMTIGDYIRGTGVEQRGEYFERFLHSIGKQNADAVIGPIGTPETAGVVREPGTQLVIRSQRVADHLNQMMGGNSGSSGPKPPSGPSTPPPPAPPSTPPANSAPKKGQPSVWREGSGTSIYNPKPGTKAAPKPKDEPQFTEAERLIIESYIGAGKPRAEAEKLVKEMRDPENQVKWTRPDGPNTEGTTRNPYWKPPGSGKK